MPRPGSRARTYKACILFTFADLDPRKETESALRQSEQRFSTAFRLVPVPIAIAALDHFRLVEVNDAFREVTGFSDEQLVGRTPSELGLWSDDTQQLFDREIKKTHGIRGFELEMRAKNGERVACLVSAEVGRERDVLGLICQGRNDAEIGEVLKLSRNTVRNHLASLYRKLGRLSGT